MSDHSPSPDLETLLLAKTRNWTDDEAAKRISMPRTRHGPSNFSVYHEPSDAEQNASWNLNGRTKATYSGELQQVAKQIAEVIATAA